MNGFNMEEFLEELNAVRGNIKEAMTPEETAATQAGAAARVGGGVAPGEAVAEMHGAENQAAKAEVRAAAAADELASINAPQGNTVQDQKQVLARKIERLAGQQLTAEAAAEQAIDTAASAPPNATNMAKGAEEVDEEGEDRLMSLLSNIHDKLSKEASGPEADEAIKLASEAVQYGRMMALGFMDQLQEVLSGEETEEVSGE